MDIHASMVRSQGEGAEFDIIWTWNKQQRLSQSLNPQGSGKTGLIKTVDNYFLGKQVRANYFMVEFAQKQLQFVPKIKNKNMHHVLIYSLLHRMKQNSNENISYGKKRKSGHQAFSHLEIQYPFPGVSRFRDTSCGNVFQYLHTALDTERDRL